jgi:hypothetical protein
MNIYSAPSRRISTIIGYRHLCDELEAENQALTIQLRELRARLCDRVAPAFAPLNSLQTAGGPAFSRPNFAVVDAAGARHSTDVG